MTVASQAPRWGATPRCPGGRSIESIQNHGHCLFVSPHREPSRPAALCCPADAGAPEGANLLVVTRSPGQAIVMAMKRHLDN